VVQGDREPALSPPPGRAPHHSHERGCPVGVPHNIERFLRIGSDEQAHKSNCTTGKEDGRGVGRRKPGLFLSRLCRLAWDLRIDWERLVSDPVKRN